MTSIQAETILLFGEVLADIFEDRKVFGGAPFNVARHLQAFGLHPVLISRIGNDELRRELLAVIKDAGMDDCGIQLDASHPTGQVMVHMEEGKHRFDILPEQAYDYIHAGITHMITLAMRPQLIYFGTLAQRSTKSAQALGALIRSSNAPRLLDINLREPWYDAPTIERSLRRANLLKLNWEELDMLASLFRLSGKNPAQNADALIKCFGLDSVLVTCGEQGAWQLDNEGKIESVKGSASSQPLVDTVGAGDGFASVYILGLLRGWPVTLILSRANAFAAALCEIRGAIPDSPDFYEPFIKDWNI
ncbi:carbohydrate kinase family protein [Nitrosomonas sp.]|uniref:carbohydrate kinase family protein n=1 Tax=Nitrosomonas sp. TaxID=42353 RepID=UPI001DB710D3|nr:carbohydrate kinase [Nitrosomonas sp.]MBX3615554.1 carbohydrate kinase [Nitrosomonas sp.]